jgi:hypothetical protein
VPAASWGPVWVAVVRDVFLGHVDLGTRDAARIFYLPSAPPGATPVVYTGAGDALDASELRLDGEYRRRPLTLPGDTAPITKGERRPKLMSIAGRLRNAGAGYDAILAELRQVNETRCVEKLAERELAHISASACQYEAGPHWKDSPPGPSPDLDAFDPEAGAVFETVSDDGSPAIGIAFVRDGRIHRTTLADENRRISRRYEEATKGRPSEDAAAERDRATKRLIRTLPFTAVKGTLWPLPSDPTTFTVAAWESEHGSLLDALVSYLSERITTSHPDDLCLVALYAIAASVRSPATDFAPRLLIEGPTGWGKSTSAEAVQLVVSGAVYGAALTAAAIYRIMDQWHPTLLADESTINEHPEIRQVLRAGFKRGAKIIRATQNSDTGVVVVDPFGFALLTALVDLPEDVVNRCFVVRVPPGEPPKHVWQGDPEARELRTVLTRLRLEVLAGTAYPDIAVTAQEARAKPGLERRSRDKLTALWPYAKHYGVTDRLVDVASRLESESTDQLATSDKGIVVAALAAMVKSTGGLAALKAPDLDVVNVHEFVRKILVAEGEARIVGGEMELDQRKYSSRDFTARLVRELGLKVKPVEGRARIDRSTFLVLWPNISSRYGAGTSLDDFAERDGELSRGEGANLPRNDPYTPTILPRFSSGDGGSDAPLRYPTETVGHPTEIVGGVGITGVEGSPPRKGLPDPVEDRIGPARGRHFDCGDCQSQDHHVCEGCPRCRSSPIAIAAPPAPRRSGESK